MSDRVYVIKRNRLIRFAVREANVECGEVGLNRMEWSDWWNRVFLGAMDRMAREVGLVEWQIPKR